mgnify:CR=1 FL=1
MIENFSPRVLDKLRVNYAELIKVKPDIIQVSMSAFGKTGPYRDRTSYGPGIDATTGAVVAPRSTFLQLRLPNGAYDPVNNQLGTPFQAQFGLRFFFFSSWLSSARVWQLT